MQMSQRTSIFKRDMVRTNFYVFFISLFREIAIEPVYREKLISYKQIKDDPTLIEEEIRHIYELRIRSLIYEGNVSIPHVQENRDRTCIQGEWADVYRKKTTSHSYIKCDRTCIQGDIKPLSIQKEIPHVYRKKLTPHL